MSNSQDSLVSPMDYVKTQLLPTANAVSTEQQGTLISPCIDFPNVLMFISANYESSSSALIVIPGLTEGMLSPPWMSLLTHCLKGVSCCAVQVNLSSSFRCCGLSTLENDVKEISRIIQYIREKKKNIKKIFVLGFSTGAQDICLYLKKNQSSPTLHVDGVICVSGISDRYALRQEFDKNMLTEMEQEAKTKKSSTEIVLSKKLFGCFFTSYRFLSLYEKEGDDDMFSPDLSDEYLSKCFSGATCPIRFFYGEKDEYVFDPDDFKNFVNTKLKKIVSEISKDCQFSFYPTNHSFSDDEAKKYLVLNVCQFIHDISIKN